MEGLKPADIVFTTAGHDSGSPFLVLGVQNGRVLLCDGRLRKLRNPKLKSLKHLRFGKPANPELAAAISCGRATDKAIRTEIAIFRNEVG